MRKLLTFFSSACVLGASAHGAFFDPSWVDGTESENFEWAWWDGFSDPYTEWVMPEAGETFTPIPLNDGDAQAPNLPNGDSPFNTNTDAVLIQNLTPLDSISSSGGIYSSSGPTQFVIYDNPAYSAGSVLLQTRSLAAGTPPDISSARLLYRTEDGGVLHEAAFTGSGYAEESAGIFAAWEWDLSAFNIFDYFITFSSVESSMSLQEVYLDTIDVSSSQLYYALTLGTNSEFLTLGSVDHHLEGETEPELSYQIGDTIELTPVPNNSYDFVFSGWMGDLTGSDNPATITMAVDLEIKAIFSPTIYQQWAWNTINFRAGTPDYSSTSDQDGNGLDNFLEYAFGGQPESAADEATVRPKATVSSDGQYLQLTYHRQPAATDLAYTVKVSDDMQTWHYNGDGGGPYTELLTESVTLNENGTETVTVRDLTPIPSGGTRFMMLDVSPL